MPAEGTKGGKILQVNLSEAGRQKYQKMPLMKKLISGCKYKIQFKWRCCQRIVKILEELKLMADGALNTVFAQEEFDKIKRSF
jgi:hypothetical protein